MDNFIFRVLQVLAVVFLFAYGVCMLFCLTSHSASEQEVGTTMLFVATVIFLVLKKW
jgi:hypothetical protein